MKFTAINVEKFENGELRKFFPIDVILKQLIVKSLVPASYSD